MSDNKTIIAPRAVLDAWDNALRSGEYIQGQHTMETRSGKYCCLGVLEMVLEGEVENATVPSFLWLERHGISFYNDVGGLCVNPHIKSEGVAVSTVNDIGTPFSQIADLIKQHSRASDE